MSQFARGTYCVIVGKKILGEWHYGASTPMPQWKADALVKQWRAAAPPADAVAFVRHKDHDYVRNAEIQVDLLRMAG